jgi:myo-inositol-1(or 4)-monophosphatase
VASGRTDGVWQFGLKPWDVAAGILLIREAGGRVTNLKGEHHDLFAPTLIAGNPQISLSLHRLLGNHYVSESDGL